MRIERGPDFENDKIRTWKFGPEDQEVEEVGRDPTMLSLDVEREEIFESRTYRFRPGLEALAYLTDLVASQQHALQLSPEEVMQGVGEMMEGITLKFLAKRRKEDGLVSSLLVAVRSGDRCLLSRQEWVEVADYRQKVQDFEAGFLPEGVLAPPLVVTLEEWRRYAHESPFSGTRPNARERR